MRQHRSPGFTLIEVTIVVAILAVLAAIAIPLYGAYLSRTQATVALGEIAPGKTAYELLLSQGATASASYAPDGLGLQAETRNCTVSTSAPDANGSGYIACAIKGRADVAGRSLTLTRDDQGWHCRSDLETLLLPSGCTP
jgi:type IV pilus assembly protein PilA